MRLRGGGDLLGGCLPRLSQALPILFCNDSLSLKPPPIFWAQGVVWVGLTSVCKNAPLPFLCERLEGSKLQVVANIVALIQCFLLLLQFSFPLPGMWTGGGMQINTKQ